MIPLNAMKTDSSVSTGYMVDQYAEHKLKCMLQNSKCPIAITELRRKYRDTFRHEFPHKELGFASLEEYLKSLYEVSCAWCEKSQSYFVAYTPQKFAVGHQPAPKIEVLSSYQGGNSHSDARPKYKNHVFLDKYTSLDKTRSLLIDLVKDCKDGISIPKLSLLYEERTGEKLDLYDHGFNRFYEFIYTVDELMIRTKNNIDMVFWAEVPQSSRYHYFAADKHIKHKKQSLFDNEDYLDCTSSFTSSGNSNGSSTAKKKSSTAECHVSDTVKHFFRTILKNHPEGVWASQFCQKYKELTGHYFEMQSIGYYNFISLIEDLPSIFAWKETMISDGDFLLFDAETYEESEECGKALKGDAFDKLRPIKKLKTVILDIKDLLSFHEAGIYLDDFFYIYKLNFGRIFSLEEFGWKSLKLFLDSIADDVPLCIISSSKKTKVYGCHSKVPYCPADSMKCSVPSDVVDYEAKFKSQWIPADLNLKDLINIFISSLNSPHDFSIQFDDGSTTGVVEQLMKDMLMFYNSDDGELYKMNDVHVASGIICAGISDEDANWHRTEIRKVFADSVEVLFVDFGSIGIIHRKDLRYLKKKFFDVPSQAVAAQLANIKPYGVRWNKNVKKLLLDLYCDTSVKCCIYGYKMAEQLLYLYIWKVNDDPQSYSASDILIRDGHAHFCNDDKDVGIIINPYWSYLKSQTFSAAKTNSKNSDIAATLPTALSNLSVGSASKNKVKTANGVASVYNHPQNSHLSSDIQDASKSTEQFSPQGIVLQMLLHNLSQSSANKNPYSVEFTNQLLLLSLLQSQNHQPHHNTSHDMDQASQTKDFLHSLLCTLNQNDNSNAHSFDSSLCQNVAPICPNKPSYCEAKTVSQGLMQNMTSAGADCASNYFPNLQASLMPAGQFHPDVKSTSSLTHPSNLSSPDRMDDVSHFIPPPQPPSQLRRNELPVNISPSVHSSSFARHSSIYSTSSFSSASLSHSLSSLSSDETYAVFRSPSSSSSAYDQGFFSESMSPSSGESVPSLFKSAAERSEPDVYNEMYEDPLEDLCAKIMSKSNRNVKRLFMKNHITIHLIKLLDRPHISCHDVALITVGCGSTDQLKRKAQEKRVYRTPINIYKTNNEVLFAEIEKHRIREITHKKINDQRTLVLQVFPFRLALDFVRALAPNPEETIENIKFQMVQPDVDFA